jgi:replication-associated recombination protein RarA
MQCLPDNLVGRKYYIPGEEGFEKKVAQRLETLDRLKKRRAQRTKTTKVELGM